MPTIRVVDHAPSPGGRYKADGKFSGQWFRDDILRPALEAAMKSGQLLVIELDGTSGYGSSFLEEAFGGLIRSGAFRRDELRQSLVVVAKTELYAPYKTLADRFIDSASRQSAA